LFANGERLAVQLPTIAFVPESPGQPESRIETAAPTRPVETLLPEPVPESRAESRVESPASSRAKPVPDLPEVWGRISAVEGVKKLESVVALKPGETDVFVESALDSHGKWKWKLRLLDSSHRPVVEADLNPLFGPRTLQGTLRLGPIPKGRTLTAEFVITDADGHARSQKVGSPQFVESLEGAPKPLVRLKIAGRDDVVLELDRALAPDAVEAFLEHARSGDYDGCAFHEVKKNQHVRAGVFDGKLVPKRGPAAPLPSEWGRTRTKFPRMSVAMTGQAEFQILMQNTPTLGIMMAPPIEIGRVVKGEDVLVAISQEPVTVSGDFRFAPEKPVVILKAIVEGEIGEVR
jgi:cyclophilin family peptidyl-prolyl cis-trans isomerase